MHLCKERYENRNPTPGKKMEEEKHEEKKWKTKLLTL